MGSVARSMVTACLAVLIVWGCSAVANDFASNDPNVYYRATKAMTSKFYPLVQAVLMELPVAGAFDKHRDLLSSYLKETEDAETRPGLCFLKTFKKLEDFVQLLSSVKGLPGAETEATAVLQLFSDNGYGELEQDFHKFVEGYDNEKFIKQVETLTETADNELLEEC